jgi:hypothetical protein
LKGLFPHYTRVWACLIIIKESLDIDGKIFPFEQIEEALFKFGKDRNWDSKLAKWGRSGQQSLLVHALNTYSIAKKLCLNLTSNLGLSDFDILITLITSFLHDIGKETFSYQES